MAGDRVQGLADAYALFDAIPQQAQEELDKVLTDIGEMAYSEERADVPERTGALAAGLRIQELLNRLRVRIGLIGLAGGRAKLFYGRIINFGRRAQVVIVSRRKVGIAKRLTAGRKRASDIAATYALHVTALPAREFITADRPDFNAAVAARLADFWSNVLGKAQ
jgi:hypothetical protein